MSEDNKIIGWAEEYIQSIPWSDDVSQYEKALVAGNIRLAVQEFAKDTASENGLSLDEFLCDIRSAQGQDRADTLAAENAKLRELAGELVNALDRLYRFSIQVRRETGYPSFFGYNPESEAADKLDKARNAGLLEEDEG